MRKLNHLTLNLELAIKCWAVRPKVSQTDRYTLEGATKCPVPPSKENRGNRVIKSMMSFPLEENLTMMRKPTCQVYFQAELNRLTSSTTVLKYSWPKTTRAR